jgi:hypothetical protein
MTPLTLAFVRLQFEWIQEVRFPIFSTKEVASMLEIKATGSNR